MNRLCLVAVGDKYLRLLGENIAKIQPESYSGVHILTSDLKNAEKIISQFKLNEKFFIYYIDEKEFNYFHKLYFSLNISIEFKETVTYVDIMRISLLSKFTPGSKTDGIHYVSPWGPFLSNASLLKDYGCEYFEKGYWNKFIEKLTNLDIKPEKIIPVVEQILIINYNKNLAKLKEHLKVLESDFIRYSESSKSVYKKAANGEGLALGYSCYLLNIPLYLLKRQTSYLI